MSSGFTVDPALIDAHAGYVDELAGRMRRVADAGQPLDIAAYGLIGQLFARSAIEATRSGAVAVGSLTEQIIAIGDAVRATSAAYLAAESRSTETFRGVR